MKKTTEDYFRDWYANTFGFGYGTGDVYYCSALLKFFGGLELDEDGPHRYSYEVMESKLGAATFWFLLNTLCEKDIVEYGTSPRFGWLADKGRKMADFLRVYNEDQLYDLVNFDSDYVPCYPTHCNHTELQGKGCITNPFW